MQILDRFDVMTWQLSGLPIPPAPAIPGRRHAARDDLHKAVDLPNLSAGEVADAVCISLRAAKLRISVATESGDWSCLLAPVSQPLPPRRPGTRPDHDQFAAAAAPIAAARQLTA